MLFKQFDRSVQRTSDIWHTALTHVTEAEDAPPRRSFDLRCLVIFHERVAHEADRFSGAAVPRWDDGAPRQRPVSAQTSPRASDN